MDCHGIIGVVWSKIGAWVEPSLAIYSSFTWSATEPEPDGSLTLPVAASTSNTDLSIPENYKKKSDIGQ